MSLFDLPKEEKLSDVFEMGEKFWLVYAEYEGVQPTTYGAQPQASISVCPVGQSDEIKNFRVWGVLAKQIEDMEDGDIPAEVFIGKQGRKHVWTFVQKVNISDPVAAASAEAEDAPF
jgi:hypothetical protein